MWAWVVTGSGSEGVDTLDSVVMAGRLQGSVAKKK